MTREIVEFAYDLHAGLSALQIPEFDDIPVIGMAATMAVHIKGLGEIEYEVLRMVSDHFMSIPPYALERVISILSDVGFVKVVAKGRKIDKIIPNIPRFDDVYEEIGEYVKSECSLNGYEQAVLLILGKLHDAPWNKDALFNDLGIEKAVFNRCLSLGESSGIVSEHKARGRRILISPFYFADNLDGLADAAAAAGASAIGSALSKVRQNQGWPLSLIEATGEIGGTALPNIEGELIRKLSEEGVIKPPTIKFGTTSESFVFTPKPGKARLNAANKEIYERAMALTSAVRKGQLLPERIRIRSPILILQALRDRGFLKASSEAMHQYRNLVFLRVGRLKEVSPGRWQFHLNRTAENETALKMAIDLLRSGELANMEVDQEARIALSKDEQYIQSLISSAELRKREKQILKPETMEQYDQLLLKLGE